MKKPIIKIVDKILLLLLGFSGMFYSCYKYGMPVAEYEINGAVTDKESKPIQDIRIIRQAAYYDSNDTLYTNSEGKFHIKFFDESHYARLSIEDIDGEANGGEFASQEVDVIFTDADLVKKKNDKYAKTIGIVLRTIDDDDYEIMYGAPCAPFKP